MQGSYSLAPAINVHASAGLVSATVFGLLAILQGPVLLFNTRKCISLTDNLYYICFDISSYCDN